MLYVLHGGYFLSSRVVKLQVRQWVSITRLANGADYRRESMLEKITHRDHDGVNNPMAKECFTHGHSNLNPIFFYFFKFSSDSCNRKLEHLDIMNGQWYEQEE